MAEAERIELSQSVLETNSPTLEHAPLYWVTILEHRHSQCFLLGDDIYWVHPDHWMLAAVDGVEPSFRESKSRVLPLYDTAMVPGRRIELQMTFFLGLSRRVSVFQITVFVYRGRN